MPPSIASEMIVAMMWSAPEKAEVASSARLFPAPNQPVRELAPDAEAFAPRSSLRASPPSGVRSLMHAGQLTLSASHFSMHGEQNVCPHTVVRMPRVSGGSLSRTSPKVSMQMTQQSAGDTAGIPALVARVVCGVCGVCGPCGPCGPPNG